MDLNYKTDFIVENKIIVELKAVENILPLHEAQLLTYLKLSEIPLGLLINFNAVLLKDGIRRRALSQK
ncbi:MAG TPA: GxxExxY protein [Patescibacteria group bacterium]|nr:GxxExxY protein [Patescibacteria group bacterium]